MLTRLKSTMRVLCMLTYLSSGTWLLQYEENLNPVKFSTRRTYGTGRPHVGLCPIFLVIIFFNARSPKSIGRSPRNFAT